MTELQFSHSVMAWPKPDFFQIPDFQIYTIVYNSAGKLSTFFENVLFSGFSTLRRTGGFVPVLWSRGASPSPQVPLAETYKNKGSRCS